MEKKPGAMVLVVGGALMSVGALLTWLTAKLDLSAVAAAVKQQIGIDISTVPSFANSQASFSAAGTKGWEGKLALLLGIIAIVVGIVLIVATMSASVASRVGLVTGAIGILVAVEAMLTKSSGIDSAKAASAGSLAGSGLTPSIFDNAFKVSVGIGLYITIVGGVLAIVGGIMLAGKEDAVMSATPASAPMASSGFDAPAPTTAPPMPPPMPSSAPEPPAGDAGAMNDPGGVPS